MFRVFQKPSWPPGHLTLLYGNSVRLIGHFLIVLGSANVRDDSQVMSVVDKYEPQGFVSVKDTKGKVSKPGLGIKVMHPSQNPLALVEQRPKLRWRDVVPRQHGIRRPPAASRDPAA